MKIEVVNRRTGRTCWVASKVFGKLLHLARGQGWRPPGTEAESSSGSWNTEIMLPHLGAYVPGTVSELDARGLVLALAKVISVESPGLHPSLRIAALAMLEVAKDGEFEVQLEGTLA